MYVLTMYQKIQNHSKNIYISLVISHLSLILCFMKYLTSQQYIEILRQNAIAIILEHYENDDDNAYWIHDNSPMHTALNVFQEEFHKVCTLEYRNQLIVSMPEKCQSVTYKNDSVTKFL